MGTACLSREHGGYRLLAFSADYLFHGGAFADKDEEDEEAPEKVDAANDSEA